MEHIRLIGKTITPIVQKKMFKKRDEVVNEIKITISRKYFTEILKPYDYYSITDTYGKMSYPNRPFPYDSHKGYVYFDFLSEKPKEDIKYILDKYSQIGHYKSEGMGRIEWLEYKIFDDTTTYDEISTKIKRFKLSKSIPKDIDESKHQLLIAGLLHDFVRTEKHPSKLRGFEIEIENDDIRWLVENHHIKSKNHNLKKLRYADGIASIMRDRKEFLTSDYARRGFPLILTKDLNEIKEEIEKRQNNFYELYDYIYNCEKLDWLVADQKSPNSSLREHLLLTCQILIRC